MKRSVTHLKTGDKLLDVPMAAASVDRRGADRLDLEFAKGEDALRTSLVSRSIEPGSQAWNDEMTIFCQTKTDSYSQLFDLSGDRAAAKNNNWNLVQISDGLNTGRVEFLQELKIDIYRPLMRSLKPVPRDRLSHSQRRSPLKPMREKVEPFFPGYAFIDYSRAGDRWREIFKMAHIRGLVCNNNMPVEVPWEMITKIQGLEVNGMIPGVTPMSHLSFMVGENVRVVGGPFAQFSGTIERLPTYTDEQMGRMTVEELDDSLRVHLLVHIFGRSTPLALSLADIEKV